MFVADLGGIRLQTVHNAKIMDNKVYVYVVKRDYGFAPNPFNGVLSLATCKPYIRKSAQVGDIIVGHTPADDGNKILFMVKVDEVLSFDEYWKDERFASKHPAMNGSTKRQVGDNIYHRDEQGNWLQDDSHHSYENGVVNPHNLNRDTSHTDRVLLGRQFIYLGKSKIDCPKWFEKNVCTHIGHKTIDISDAQKLWSELENMYPEKGLIDYPQLFDQVERYDGES